MKKKYLSPRNSGKPSLRKFKGFGYYLMGNDKLSKKNREEFISKSSSILQRVYHSLPNDTETKMSMNLYSEMDSNLSDLELLNQWNHMYDTYGYLIDEFREKWEKEQLKGEPTFKPNSKFEYQSEIEELKERISKLEMELKMLRMKGSKRVDF
jgi:hypothetical protein